MNNISIVQWFRKVRVWGYGVIHFSSKVHLQNSSGKNWLSLLFHRFSEYKNHLALLLKIQGKGNPSALLLGMQTVWEFLKKLKIQLLFDPVIPPRGLYPKNPKELKCSSVDKWIEKLWYIYTMEYYTAVKKEETLTFCNNMDGPEDYYVK